VQSSGEGDVQKFGELLCFASYSLRTMAVGVTNREHRVAIAQMLAETPKLTEPTELERFLRQNTLRLTDEAAGGSKSFTWKIWFDKNGFNTRLKSRGFGLLGRGIGYYSPVSVMLSLAHMISARSNDRPFLNGLAKAGQDCGRIGLLDSSITVAVEQDVSWAAAISAYPNAFTIDPDTEKVPSAARQTSGDTSPTSTVRCPQCNQSLRVPSNKRLKVTCTACKEAFLCTT
jgi:hypothetical protein